jgi:hypothetical protein
VTVVMVMVIKTHQLLKWEKWYDVKLWKSVSWLIHLVKSKCCNFPNTCSTCGTCVHQPQVCCVNVFSIPQEELWPKELFVLYSQICKDLFLNGFFKGNACYHGVLNLLFSHLTYKIIKITVYKL